MNLESAASLYAQTACESAPPLKIIHMMYEGALRFLEQAERSVSTPAEFTSYLNRADAIVSELRLTLDPSHAPELADKLNGLYLFVEAQIREAFLETRVEPLAHARTVLQTLLEGWKGVEISPGKAHPPA